MRMIDWSSDVCSSDLALIGEALARLVQPLRVGRRGGERDLVAVRRHHALDRHRPQQRGLAGACIALRRQLALRRVDDEEAAIEHARRHAGQVELRLVPGIFVPLVELPAGPLRSEGHTAELPSLMLISYASFCLTNTIHIHNT